jgi:hypothetical protein
MPNHVHLVVVPATADAPAPGRPLGRWAFVEKLQALLGRTLLPQKRGAKPKRKRKRNQV